MIGGASDDLERPAGEVAIMRHAPRLFDLPNATRTGLPIIRTLARWLFRLAFRVHQGGYPDLADVIADGGDALGAVLRACKPVLVCGNFAADSPLRRRPAGRAALKEAD